MIPLLRKEKGYIKVRFYENETISTDASWERTQIPFKTEINSNNMKLSNGKVVIGKGIKRVLAIFTFITANDLLGVANIYIYKNGSSINSDSVSGYNRGFCSQMTVSEIIDVKEGDVLSAHVAFSIAREEYIIHQSTNLLVLET